MKRIFLLAALAYCATACVERSDSPRVQTTLGDVEGVLRKGSEVFWGLPFAAPPVGGLRWNAPEKPAAWNDTRVADTKPANCPQSEPRAPENYTGEFFQSEDCLYLNVWRPTGTRAGAGLPVMVWIHGGSFRAGAGSWSAYDGDEIVKRDVVLVTINYRLGLLGRFAHPELLDEQVGQPVANYGLMDQIAALGWVQEHIDRFGGDKDNVTIFGYSAGGVSVNYLMAAPMAEGLFDRAISQSGGIQVEGSRHVSMPGAARLVEPLVSEGLKAAKDFAAGTAAQLRSIPADALVEWADRNLVGSLNPVQDDVLIPVSVGRAFREGAIASVDYLAGVTDWEGSLLSGVNIPPIAILGTIPDLQDVRKIYPDLDDKELMDAWFADNTFVGAARYLAGRSAAMTGRNSWLYNFSYLANGVRDALPGVPHGDDVPYIFGSLPGKIRGLDAAAVTASDWRVSNLMIDYWTNFAKSGDPNGDGLPEWPSYDAESDRWLDIGETVAVRAQYRAEVLHYLAARYERIMDTNHTPSK